MATIHQLQFRKAVQPVLALVTKFGGQPVWLAAPAAPLSRRTGKPMTFIGQIRVPPDWLGDQRTRMAYIFMTGGGFDYQAMETWDPADGETAVIVQSGTASVPSATRYPDTLKQWTEDDGDRREVPCEYVVESNLIQEPPYMSHEETCALDEAAYTATVEAWRGNKIGGSPYWVQGEEIPYEKWHLLLQLEDGTYPFNLNLGTGVGYVFLNSDCTEGQLRWQC